MLPGRSGDAPVRRHDRVVHRADAALASDQRVGLPHPRGRLDRRAGARVHDQGRPDLRRAGDRARPRRRRLRAAPELLLQRPGRLLRGDRQVPRGAAHLGARAARALRRAGSALVADALPHADGGRLADRPAAAEQHRPHGDRGARRRARRHPVAAHELLRRGARAADRGGRADRAAHAADHRPRDRRDEHDRPARRRVLRRGADRPARARGLRLLQPHRRARRDGRGRQAELPAARDRRRRVRAAVRVRQPRADPRRRQRLRRRRRRGDPDAAHRPRARAQAARAAGGGARAARRRARSSGRSPRCARRRRSERANLMPALLDCARAHASEGEIVRALQDVFGTYTETPVF